MNNKYMQKYYAVCAMALATVPLGLSATAQESNGNPRPGYPHDTITIHVKKATDNPVQCDGGHALFLREDKGDVLPAQILVTMTDWAQIDNDNDGLFDEDPMDGVDNDLDGLIDEDAVEPGAETTAIDCDAWGDGLVKLQIQDADPRAGWVSTQEWFIRAIGKPGENIAFTTSASQVVECHQVLDEFGNPVLDDLDQPVIECTYGDWIEVANFNLAALGAVKQVKGTKAGGKTPFADITSGFQVDLEGWNDLNGNTVIDLGDDLNGDGVGDINDDLNGDGAVNSLDVNDRFIFSISCYDNPDTTLDETLYCPLSNLIWDIDDEDTTSKAKAQVFVSHTGSSKVSVGKIKNSQ